ncbi:MAG: S-adenosylmethionine:tRNA ribosyltransferase-isomerase [Chitinophagaceae bacterium]|nr:S-adenosylmethionine:tRNA ribosyltransferase-isomerase [Chitinophagaceae bacterium]
MTDPRNISINDFTYSLPEERIAKYPLAERDASKLLIYKNGGIKTDTYRQISKYIPEDSVLVFNNTKVIEARLLFQKETGGVIEIFCLEPHEQYADITTAMLQKEKVFWHCLVGGASKWKAGQVLQKEINVSNQKIILEATYHEKRTGTFIIELSWTPASLSFAEVLHFTGAIPLPPYIKRNAEETDKVRYQTIYAATDGSVAAPTAGLHFTPTIFNDLDNIHVVREFVTLHVGAGTFKPVKSETMLGHDMHAEWIEVSKSLIENLLKDLEEPIIAVGTTSLRTLESIYWLGVKLSLYDTQQPLFLSQWEAYELEKKKITASTSLNALLNWMKKNNSEKLITKTQILIVPGYKFKIVQGLVTNFHQPQSTLLLLVAALIGEDWKKVYEYALKHDFRFLSYGDGSLLWRKED